MTRNLYDEATLRSLIDNFTNPISVVQEGRIRMANDAYLAMHGLSREQVEGRSFFDFLHPEDLARLRTRYRLREQGMLAESDPRRYVLPARPGVGPRELAVHVQEVELEGSGFALLCNHLVLGDRPSELEMAERLVETSAKLVAARSEEAVRRIALEGFQGVGLAARFLVRQGERFSPLEGFEEALALRALSEGRPVFGHFETESTAVYLALGTPSSEVLWVVGSQVRPSYGPVLELFAKVVGAALLDARLLADVERSRWELSSVAEVARFVALPEPPSPEDFLARLSLLVGAEAVVLYGSDSPEGPPGLVAQVGLEPAQVEALPMPRGEWLLAEMSARGVVLSSEAEEREWSALSAGRLVRSAAVPLLLGGQPGGLLQVLRGASPPFSAEELRLLGTLAELLMMLLEQRRLRAESARQLTDSRLLLDLARTTATTLEVASILDVASDFLVKLLDVSNCFILLHDEQAGVLRGAAASVTHRDFFRGLVVPVDDPESLAARVARERRSISVPDLSKAGSLGRRSLVQQLGQKAMLALPLTSREQLIGVVLLDDIRRPRLFPTAFIELAEATCGQIALAITNARLYESLWASYAELAAARAEMVKRERLAALGELSAIVAHEVRNPLGAIFNAVASLRHLLKPDGDTAMLLDILAEESDRLDRMVSDLLDYTRPREPIRQLEDVARMLQDAVEAAWKQQGSPSHITPTIEVEPQLPRVPLDRRHIRQVLINMLVNAMQAMPQGGGVRVLARRELHEDRELLRIDVVDQGCGIPTELIHRVFEPFFTTKAQGTGLGLAVVKRIIEEHHGELSLESTPGRGTTFSIRLPLNQPTSPP
ncbi:GAF domain-containing protein [Cystobacter fuscus]|uniref:ATP-binding protein n=1 Tax=Cystobacter fuscus TaxID=43 RepID=UPI002B311157|nr:GAF domain-containing protein [Cystobacter fuscus]